MGTSGDAEHGASRAVLAYNVYRLGLLAVCLGIGWLLGLPSLVMIVAALSVSGVLSWFLLRRQREAMGLAVERTVARGQARLAAHTAAEDGYLDGVRGAQESSTASTETQRSATPRGDQSAL